MRDGQTVRPTLGLIQEKLIGRFVWYWSKLESSMEGLIWEFFDVDIEYGRVITSRMDASIRIQTLRLLGKRQYKNAQLDKLNTLLTEIDDLRLIRNFIVHGAWATLFPELIPVAMSVREKSDDPAEVGWRDISA
jgi:hypothetical protein